MNATNKLSAIKINSLEEISKFYKKLEYTMKEYIKLEDTKRIILGRIKYWNKEYNLEKNDEAKKRITKNVKLFGKTVKDINAEMHELKKKIKNLIKEYIILKEDVVISSEEKEKNKEQKIYEIFNNIYERNKAEYYKNKKNKFKMFSEIVAQ